MISESSVVWNPKNASPGGAGVFGALFCSLEFLIIEAIDDHIDQVAAADKLVAVITFKGFQELCDIRSARRVLCAVFINQLVQ